MAHQSGKPAKKMTRGNAGLATIRENGKRDRCWTCLGGFCPFTVFAECQLSLDSKVFP